MTPMDIGKENEDGTCIPDSTPVPESPAVEPTPAAVPEPEYEIAGS